MKPNIFMNKFIQTSVGLVGLVAAAITIYAYCSQARGIDIQYHIIGNTNVFDINADITRLDITYDSASLKEGHQNLRIYQLKITNSGSNAVLLSYYDPSQPLGFGVQSGKVIETPEVIQASNDYLRGSFKVLIDSMGNASFSQVILDKNAFVVVKFLVIHDRDGMPQIVARGKVAEQQTIQLYDDTNVKAERPFWRAVLEGDFLVQTARLLCYTASMVIIVLIVGLCIAGVSTTAGRQNRKRHVRLFKNSEGYEYRRTDDVIFDRYVSDDHGVLIAMDSLTNDERALNQTYRPVRESLDAGALVAGDAQVRSERIGYLRYRQRLVIKDMITDGLVINDGGRLSVNKQMKAALSGFMAFLDKVKKSNRGPAGATALLAEDLPVQSTLPRHREKPVVTGAGQAGGVPEDRLQQQTTPGNAGARADKGLGAGT